MARDPFTLMKIFAPLSVDLDREDSFPKKRPLLAHYTTVGVLEAILRNKEVWFSNPLFMNDVEEVLWGIDLGAKLLKSSSEVQASCETPRRFEMLLAAFNDFYSGFTNEHVLDLYVLCLSEHAKDGTDGLLSMWRGYGGNGNGAAIVLDTAQIDMHEDSPLIISKVDYGTAEKRTEWLQQRIVQFADILKKSNIADDELLFLPPSAFSSVLRCLRFFQSITVSEKKTNGGSFTGAGQKRIRQEPCHGSKEDMPLDDERRKVPALINWFDSLCSELGVENRAAKAATFKKIKDVREEVFHQGKDIDDSAFPIEETQNLVRAFLEKVE